MCPTVECLCIVFTARRSFGRDPSASGCFQLNQQRKARCLRPWTDIQHGTEKMTLSLSCWQSRNCRNGLSPERRIKRGAAPFVEQYNDKRIHVLCPSIQTSGHHFEEKQIVMQDSRVPEWRTRPRSVWCPHHFAVSVSSSTKKPGTAAAVC